MHHLRNVECLIRDLAEELVRHCFNKRMVIWNHARREAFPEHTARIIVDEIVISKDDGPRRPHPARAAGVSIPPTRRLVGRLSHFQRKARPMAVRVVLASLGPEFLRILESVEHDQVLAHEVDMDDVAWKAARTRLSQPSRMVGD